MLFNDLYDFSLYLKDQNQNEVNPQKRDLLGRQAIARAYYSCFHLYRSYALARLRYEIDTTQSSHHHLINHYFKKIPKINGQPNRFDMYYTAVRSIKNMKGLREQMEYDELVNTDISRAVDSCFKEMEAIRNHSLFKAYLSQNPLEKRFSK